MAATFVDSDVATAFQEAQTAEAAAVNACIAVWVQIRQVLTADQLAILQARPPGRHPAAPTRRRTGIGRQAALIPSKTD